MKKAENVRKVRWDPIVAKLAENRIKPTFYVFNNPQQKTSPKKADVPKERRSKDEFDAYLKSLFADDPLKVKYQTPDAWISPEPEKKKKRWRF